MAQAGSSPKVFLPYSKDLVKDTKLKLSNPSFKNDLIEGAIKCSIKNSERLNQDPYPNDFLLVNFASIVYDCKNEDNLKLPDRWYLLTTAENTNWLNKYFAAVFVDYQCQHVVLAHRGTDPSKFGCLWADARGVYGHKTVGQISSAASFADMIRTTLEQLNETKGTNFHLSITGHSLGGWLAQITTFTVEYLEMGEKHFYKTMRHPYFHPHTVAFDSPGCEEMLLKLKEDYYLRYYNPLSLDILDITTFLSAPNKVNTCNHHIGSLFRLRIEYNLNFLQKHTALYTLSTHQMKNNFISVFSEAGEVIGAKVLQIKDWPVSTVFHNGEYKEFFKYAKASNHYHLDSNPKLIESEFGHFYTGLRYQADDYFPNVSSLRIFSPSEIWLLECWRALLGKGVALNLIHNFCQGNDISNEINCLPHYNVDVKNGTLACQDRNDLRKTVRICKQLMRWFKEIMTVMKTQLSECPASLETLLQAASTNYLFSWKQNELVFHDYNDSNISLQTFLESQSLNVLNLVMSKKLTNVEFLRIYNILHQLESKEINISNYLKTGHLIFISWINLFRLCRVLDINYIFQNDCQINLFIVDCSQSEILEDNSEEDFLRKLLSNINEFSGTSRKKFIFITSLVDKKLFVSDFKLRNEILNSELSKAIYTCNSVSNTCFRDLKDESKQFFLENAIVKFQQDHWTLHNIFFSRNMNFSGTLNDLINSDVLNMFVLGNVEININHHISNLCESEVSHLRLYMDFTEEQYRHFCEKNNHDSNVAYHITTKNQEFDEYTDQDNDKFLEFCYRNPNKKVYWIIENGNSYHLRQLYNTNFYIRRKFNYQFILDFTKRLPRTEFMPDLFVFKNVSESLEQALIKSLESCFNLIVENIIIITDSKDNIPYLERESQRSMHWFNLNDRGDYVWEKSVGSLDHLRGIIKIDQTQSFEETEMVSKRYKTLIIADEPGAGKSTTLTNLFSRMKNSWIMRIDFKDYDHIKSLRLPITIDGVVEFLCAKQCDSTSKYFIRHLLKYLLINESEISIFCLFDGFDEIRGESEKDTVNLRSNVISLLVFLKDTKAKVWVTTRPNRKEMLENNLCVFAIKFDMITMSEQVDFLKKFWKCRLDCEINLNTLNRSTEAKMDIYIKELFTKAKQIFGPTITGFIGIPLQLRILAEVAMPNIELFTDADDFQIQIPNNILDLFETFIYNKYDIYFQHKTKLSANLNDITKKWISDVLTEKHQYLALRNIFFVAFEEFQCSPNELLELNAVGLIQQNNSSSNFDFIDRNIAFYYIASVLMILLKSENYKFVHSESFSVETHMLSVILLKAEYKIIRLFLENHFGNLLNPIYEMRYSSRELTKRLTDNLAIDQLCDSKKQTVLHVLLSEECDNLFKFIVDCIQINTDISGDITPIITVRDKNYDTAFRIALKSENRSSIMLFLDLITSYSPEIQQHLLLASLFVRYEDQNSKELKTLANYLDRYSVMERIFCEMRKKYNSIRVMLDESKKGKKAMVEECFRDVGDDIYRKYILLSIDDEGKTPLLNAVKNNHHDVIGFLIEQGSDIHAEDKFNVTSIAYAARSGNLKLIEKLVKRGCDPEKPDRNRINPMLHAAKTGHLNVVKYYLELHNFDEEYVNYKDRFGNSALFWAARASQITVVRYLLEKNANIEIENKHGSRPLHVAIKSQQWNVVKYLIEKGANFNVPDGYGMTPLLQTIKTGKRDMVVYLINKGAETDTRDQNGKSARDYLEEAGMLSVLSQQ